MIQEQMSSEYEEADDIAEDQEFLPGSIAMRKRGWKGVDGSIAEANTGNGSCFKAENGCF